MLGLICIIAVAKLVPQQIILTQQSREVSKQSSGPTFLWPGPLSALLPLWSLYFPTRKFLIQGQWISQVNFYFEDMQIRNANEQPELGDFFYIILYLCLHYEVTCAIFVCASDSPIGLKIVQHICNPCLQLQPWRTVSNQFIFDELIMNECFHIWTR